MRTRILSAILSLILFSLLQSCTIEEHIHFTDKEEGTVNFRIDMSKMAAMMKSMKTDSTGQGDENNMDEALDSLSQTEMDSMFEDIEGIANFQSEVDKENYIISFSYDFESLEALNKSLAKTDEKEHKDESYVVPSDHEYFKRAGNNFYYEAPQVDMPKDTTSEDAGMEQMAGMYEFIMKITFEDKKVKSLDNEKFKIMDDEKGLIYRGSMMEILDNQKLLNMSVKLKN